MLLFSRVNPGSRLRCCGGGLCVASCDDPMYYEHIADAMGDDEVALVAAENTQVHINIVINIAFQADSKFC